TQTPRDAAPGYAHVHELRLVLRRIIGPGAAPGDAACSASTMAGARFQLGRSPATAWAEGERSEQWPFRLPPDTQLNGRPSPGIRLPRTPGAGQEQPARVR